MRLKQNVRRTFVVVEYYPESKNVGDVFGVFYNLDKANKFAGLLGYEHASNHYIVKEMLNGNGWLKEYKHYGTAK